MEENTHAKGFVKFSARRVDFCFRRQTENDEKDQGAVGIHGFAQTRGAVHCAIRGGVHAHPVGPPTDVTEGLAGGLAGLSIGSSSGATSSSLAPVAVVSNQPSVQAESDGWWSPNAVQATEISRAARASLQDQPQSGTRFPNV